MATEKEIRDYIKEAARPCPCCGGALITAIDFRASQLPLSTGRETMEILTALIAGGLVTVCLQSAEEAEAALRAGAGAGAVDAIEKDVAGSNLLIQRCEEDES